jgi:CRP-like cAMP-binding protein
MHDSHGNRDFEEVSIRTVLSEYKASPELMSAFVEKAEIRVCPRADVLFRMGEQAKNVYLILNGEIELVLPCAQDTTIGFLADTGSLIGLPAAFADEPYSMSAVALSELDIARMEPEAFKRMVESNPPLSLEVLRILAAETRGVRFAIRSLG